MSEFEASSQKLFKHLWRCWDHVTRIHLFDLRIALRCLPPVRYSRYPCCLPRLSVAPKAQGVRILAWLRHSVLSERLA